MTESATAESVTPQPPAAAEAPTAAASPQEEPAEPNQFLKELVGAMRGVAETSRDASMEELRTSLDQRIEELRAAAAERAEDLRRRSDHDITEIGEWERTEIERVRGDAEKRRDARRAQLEKELADHDAASEAEVEAARRKLDDYEHELAAFFAELERIQDPATFVSAAKRMPAPPELAGASSGAANGSNDSAAPTTPSEGSEGSANGQRSEKTLSERLAELDKQLAVAPAADAAPEVEAEAAPEPDAQAEAAPAAAPEADAVEAQTEPEPEPEPEPEHEPAAAEVEPAPEAAVAPEAVEAVAEAAVTTNTAEPAAAEAEPAPEAAVAPEPAPEPEAAVEAVAAPEAQPEPAATPVEAPAGGEALTPIVVKGLGSFGAITSFKQALERVDGVNGVTLSLGPTGEFVYRATHAPAFDIVAAIRQIEGPGAGIEQNEGQVLVTIERQR